MASLFGLAPDGVCRAGPVTSPAVGSYPAISPLPDPALRGPSAVCFLLHFPSPHGARLLAGILLYGARTFLCAIFIHSDCLANFPGTDYRPASDFKDLDSDRKFDISTICSSTASKNAPLFASTKAKSPAFAASSSVWASFPTACAQML